MQRDIEVVTEQVRHRCPVKRPDTDRLLAVSGDVQLAPAKYLRITADGAQSYRIIAITLELTFCSSSYIYVGVADITSDGHRMYRLGTDVEVTVDKPYPRAFAPASADAHGLVTVRHDLDRTRHIKGNVAVRLVAVRANTHA